MQFLFVTNFEFFFSKCHALDETQNNLPVSEKKRKDKMGKSNL